jgi:hypothetical protein
MPALLVLVVFVNTADVRAPATIALERAAEEVLGADARVSVQGYGTPPSDAELAEKSAEADVVAELVWQDEAHRHALVHCYVTKLHRFVNRELTFEDQDELGERGRLIGFALASMAPERPPESEAKEQKSESAQTLPVPAPSVPAARVSEAAAPPEKPARRAPVAAIDATVLGAVGLGGPATGLGVGLGARWFFLPRLALRLGTGVRHGEIANAQADSEFSFGAAGFGFLFSNPESSSPFTLGGRADLLLISNSLRHRSSDDAIPVHQSRVMGGADLLLEGRWYFWRQAGLLLNGGGELAFGHTNVVVRGREVADIPALRLVAELGIVANF